MLGLPQLLPQHTLLASFCPADLTFSTPFRGPVSETSDAVLLQGSSWILSVVT